MQRMSRKTKNLKDTECCETCSFWKPYNNTTGFCTDTDNWHDETLFDSWCDKFEKNYEYTL